MAYQPILNFEELLAPIPGENPCGENLLYSGLHDAVREARRAEDALPQGEWEREVKAADWGQVASLATEALRTKTKDLQIGAWLGEALVKLHGFTGLLDSLKLMRLLIGAFWDNLYPEIDNGDLEARGNALAFLDRQTAYALKEIPLTDSLTGPNYSYFQWEESKGFDIPEDLTQLDSDAMERIEALRRQAEEEQRVTSEQWRIAKNATGRAFYEETYALQRACLVEFNELDHLMDEKFQRQTPGLGALKKSLDEVNSLIERIVKEKRVLEPDTVSPEEIEAVGKETQEGASGLEAGLTSVSGPVRNRQDALRRLLEVAEYFRKTEPHSPVSYLVDRAVKWGQMPLDRWLQDVIKDASVLSQLRETLGLGSASDADQS